MEKPAKTYPFLSFQGLFPNIGGEFSLDLGASVGSFILILLQMSILTWITIAFQIESTLHLPELMPIATAGFLVNHLLPGRLKLPVFVLLSVCALGIIFGVGVMLQVVIIGLGLIVIVHLPIPLTVRIVLLVLGGVGLAFARTERLPVSISPEALIIIGSMFMFRMVLYVYELRFEKEKPVFWFRIAYFFLLPNIVFPIFPVVDYKTFYQTWYTRNGVEVYQKGIRWMLKGVLHLMGYRILYFYFLPPFSSVEGLLSYLHFAVVSYALIVRLSGLFHFAAGMLCMFGFDLPQTFNHYFLSTGFSDLWRRINIYWKDFVMKVFYYPLFFRFRKRGVLYATVTATLIAFVFNWFLHNYQWFWIQGTFPLKWTDIIFWGGFGVLVALNAVVQQKSKKKKSNRDWTMGQGVVYVSKVIGMFLFMCVLWSLWISPGIAEWGNMMVKSTFSRTSDWGISLLGLVGLYVVGVGAHYLYAKKKLTFMYQYPGFYPSMIYSSTVIIFIGFLGIKPVVQEIEQATGFDTKPILTAQLNSQDRDLMFQGYYEDILVPNTLSTQLGELNQKRTRQWVGIQNTPIVEKINSPTKISLVPNASAVVRGAKMMINSKGFRDQEYPQEKPEGTFRIALLGGSVELGSGVEGHQTFEAVAERMLNENPVLKNQSYEILNFAISGFCGVRNLILFQQKVLEYEPDLVLYFAHENEGYNNLRNVKAIFTHDSLPYPYLEKVRKKLDPDQTFGPIDWIPALKPLEMELWAWTMRSIDSLAKQNKIESAWFYLPMEIADNGHEEEYEEYASIARDIGFHVYDYSDLFEGISRETFHLAAWDRHPSVEGHAEIGKKLFKTLSTDSAILNMMKKVQIEGDD